MSWPHGWATAPRRRRKVAARFAFSSPESRATRQPTWPGCAGTMISGQFLRATGLSAMVLLVVAGPAGAQNSPFPQPPADIPQLQAPSGQLGPELLQPPSLNAPAANLQAPNAQAPNTLAPNTLAPDTQAPDTQAPDVQQGPSDAVPQQESEPTHISNPVAVFAGLDKITGRIINFDVYINETVQFGALQVTPRICYTRPPTEEPRTDAFVEVDEITLARKIQRIFTGWMFADSPGLHAVDNAVYDVWLTDCKAKSAVPPPSARAKTPAAKDTKKQ